jgi:hypothetical protein
MVRGVIPVATGGRNLAISWSDYPHWDEELRRIVQESPASYGWEDIAVMLSGALQINFTADQVRNRARRIRANRPAPPPSLAEIIPSSPLTKWEELLALIQANYRTPLPPPLVPIFKSGPGTPETMVVLVSDIHIGKLVEKEVVGGNFGYNIDVLKDRGKELFEAILRLRDLHAHHGPIPRLELFFLGDGVDGVDMRRGHSTRVDVHSASSQMIQLSRYMTDLVRALEPFFSEGIDLNWEFGNHGRVGDFGVNLPADNWDYVAGVMVQESLKDLLNVVVNVHTQKYGIYKIGPLVAYAAHGDMVRGGLSSAGIKRYVANIENLHRQTFDLALLGHFHTSELYTAGKTKVFMNGAWDGGDDFSVNQLVSATDPVQWAFGVHPKRGVTWTYEVALSPRRAPSPVLR